MPRTVAACAAALLLAITPSRTVAQISPGPLARAHASLDGSLSCAKCHGGRAESTTQRCLGCHREIGWLREQGRGFHARGEGRGACASCHPDHAGRDFQLITWPGGTPERFEHERGTGYALEQSHATLTCKSCHRTELRVSPVAALSPRRASPGWIGLERNCTSCHADPHRDKLEGGCTSCHDIGHWKDAPKFDHARTTYPLTGKHASVSCAKCHLAPRLRPATDSLGRPVPVFRPVTFSDCSSCHTDPHRGQMNGACSRCHTTKSFGAVDRTAFDHDRTRYPLRGRHAAVTCAKCHVGSSSAGMRPAFSSCTNCHRDAHAGQLAARADRGACERCHTVDGWRPTTFGSAAHASLRLPLDGAHAKTACAACHAADRRGLSPLPASVATGSARLALRPPETTCAQCHTDPHAWRRSGADATTCTTCHNTRDFRGTSIDVSQHAALGYPLEGAHRAVSCNACHSGIARPRSGSTLIAAPSKVARLDLGAAPTTCAGCHADPHKGQFANLDGGSCDRCHTMSAFAPASRFDHKRDTRFVLEGAHARVSCVACHRQPAGAPPGAPRVYGRLPTSCESCHTPGGVQ